MKPDKFLAGFVISSQVTARSDSFLLSVEHCYNKTAPTTPNLLFPPTSPSFLPPSSINRNVVDCICQTPGFAPTIENWWLSGATEWLKEYTQSHSSEARYQELGIIGFLAEDFLKKTNFQCGIDSVHRCVVECQEVVRMVEDLEEARIVWFALRSAGNIAETTKIVHDTLTAAQINMAQIVPVMANNFYWTPGTDDYTWAVIFTHTINTLSFVFGTFYPMIRGLIHINKILEDIAAVAAAKAAAAAADLQAAKDQELIYLQMPEGWPDHETKVELEGILKIKEKVAGKLEKKATRAANTAKIAKMGFNNILLCQIGSGVSHAFGKMNWHINYNAKHPGYEKPKEVNQLQLEAFIRSSAMRAREALRVGIDIIFSGTMLSDDGTSMFSNFTMAGNFLPDRSGNAKLWRDAGIEKGITRGLMLKTLNAAINSQAVYITCSKDFRHTSKNYKPIVEDKSRVDTCKKDNSGPKDFKACINGQCCYLYKWNNRGWAPQWRNDKLFGVDIMDDEPWNVKVTDIITSSVQAYYDVSRGAAPSTDLTRGIFHSLGDRPVESLWDPATPGMFTVPVCFSTHNWATVIDGYRFPQNAIIDSQPRNSVKNLPCNCGPWGRDTEGVWREIGLWSEDPKDRWFKDYTAGKCGFQIYDKIKDPVERYVAYCRVHVNTCMNFRIRHAGKHWQCNIISSVVEKLGYPTVKELQASDPEVYQALWCHIVHPGSSKRECKDYNKSLGTVLASLGKYDSLKMIEGGEEIKRGGNELAMIVSGN